MARHGRSFPIPPHVGNTAVQDPGGITISGELISAVASVQEPTVVLGNVTIAGEVPSAVTAVIDPGVILGSVVVSGELMSTTATLVGPTVTLGSINVSGEVAAVDATVIDPTIVLGSITVTSQVASVVTVVIDPTVTVGGDIIISGETASLVASVIDPTIVLGSVTVTSQVASVVTVVIDPTVTAGGDITIVGQIANVTAQLVDPAVVLGSITVSSAIASVTASVIYSTVPAEQLIVYTCVIEGAYSVFSVPTTDRLVEVTASDDVFEIKEDGSMHPDVFEMSPNELRWVRFDWTEFFAKDPAQPADTIQAVQIFRFNQIKFSSGSAATPPAQGDFVQGVPSADVVTLQRVELDSGSWADGDAQGTLWAEPFIVWLPNTDTSLTFSGGGTATADLITTALAEATRDIASPYADVKLQGGEDGYQHEVLCRMTTTAGQVKDQTLIVDVRRPRTCRVRKDPHDDLWYRFDYSDYLTKHFKFSGDTITGTATFTPTNPAGVTPIAVGTELTQTTSADAMVSGGEEDYDHEVACLISTLNGGEVREKILVLEVRQD